MRAKMDSSTLGFLICVLFFLGQIDCSVDKLDVRLGDDGTDDNVHVRICSILPDGDCCDTAVLNSGWTNDWSQNDHEVWGSEWMGQCSGLNVQPDEYMLNVFVFKSGVDTLKIKEMVIEGEDVDGNNFKYKCKFVYLLGEAKMESKQCKKA